MKGQNSRQCGLEPIFIVFKHTDRKACSGYPNELLVRSCTVSSHKSSRFLSIFVLNLCRDLGFEGGIPLE